MDITSGCVGLTAWENGSLQYQHNVHIGTLRLLETFKQNQRDSLDFPQAMAEYIHAIMSPLWGAIKRYHPSSIILSGREARIIASLMRLSMDAEIRRKLKQMHLKSCIWKQDHFQHHVQDKSTMSVSNGQ